MLKQTERSVHWLDVEHLAQAGGMRVLSTMQALPLAPNAKADSNPLAIGGLVAISTLIECWQWRRVQIAGSIQARAIELDKGLFCLIHVTAYPDELAAILQSILLKEL